MSSSLRKWLVLGSAIGVSALLFSGCSGCPGTGPSAGAGGGTVPGPQPGGDEDRPPIVVSDGSVHLRAVRHSHDPMGNNDPGAWELVSGVWVNTHTKNKKGTHLEASVLYSTDTTNHCDDPAWVFEVTNIMFTYGPAGGSSSGSFNMTLDPNPPVKNGLRTDLTSSTATVDPKVPFWLDVGAATDRVQSVTLTLKVGGTVTCKLDTTKGEVQVFQPVK